MKIIIITLFIFMTTGVLEAKTAPKGPAMRNYCYKTRSGGFYFAAVRVSGKYLSETYINRFIRNLPKKCLGTHVWDDRWYKSNLPDKGDKRYLLMFTKGISGKVKGQYYWVLIENTPSTWFVYDLHFSKRHRRALSNGEQFKRKDLPEGIEFDVMNPHNDSGYNGNDILFSFGYP